MASFAHVIEITKPGTPTPQHLIVMDETFGRYYQQLKSFHAFSLGPSFNPHTGLHFLIIAQDTTESGLEEQLAQRINKLSGPVARHKSIWEFYKAIGYNNKTKKFSQTTPELDSSPSP